MKDYKHIEVDSKNTNQCITILHVTEAKKNNNRSQDFMFTKYTIHSSQSKKKYLKNAKTNIFQVKKRQKFNTDLHLDL